MKKLFILLLLVACVSPCNDKISKKLLPICYGIIEYPEKILNLKQNFPDYYKYEYLDNDLKDSILLYENYYYLNELFERRVTPNSFGCQELFGKYVGNPYYNKINPKIRDRIYLYQIFFWEDADNGYCFVFIVDNDSYYIFDIHEMHTVKM
jgi:hypothetical protein